MFRIGDEVEFLGGQSDDGSIPWPFEKGAKFVVAGYWATAELFGVATMMSPGVAIGVENIALKMRVINAGHVLPHYDLWRADRFRKIERKRTREELYQLLGINDMLTSSTPEVVSC